MDINAIYRNSMITDLSSAGSQRPVDQPATAPRNGATVSRNTGALNTPKTDSAQRPGRTQEPSSILTNEEKQLLHLLFDNNNSVTHLYGPGRRTPGVAGNFIDVRG